MPNPTVYLTDKEQDWLDQLDETRSGAIRQAVEHYRNSRLVWFECEEGCEDQFKAHPDRTHGAVTCPYCDGEATIAYE